MERRVTSSVSEADATEAKVELMEGVIRKLKLGTLFRPIITRVDL